MTTITVPVMDETGLRQAVAEARSGDTIYVGSDIQLSAPLTISAGANLTIAGFGVTIEGSPNDGVDGSIIVDPGATLTIENMLLSEDNDDGASASHPGADALGALQNHGALTLIDDSVTGVSIAGNGAPAGNGGGVGSNGGNAVGAIYNASGALLTLQDTFISGSATGGNGGDGGNSGAGGAGGDAVGGILNDGTIKTIGAVILYNDSATAGTGGQSGGGAAGPDGVAHVNSLNNGAIVGNLAVDAASVSIENTSESDLVFEDGSALVSAMVHWTVPPGDSFIAGSVDWKIASGAAGPALTDFTEVTGGTLTSLTSGVLNFSDPDNPYASIAFQFTPTANEPRYESFTIELFDPSVSAVLGAASSTPFGVFNPVSGNLLFQNTSTGQASIWEVDGSTRTGGGAVSLNPGPTWKAVGTGDFNHDGLSDILWQNQSTGQVSVWEMSGNTRTGGGAVSINPGTSWKAVGTGDLYGGGDSDILWQNQSTGQVSIWEMDGNTRIGGGAVGINPGPTWKAVGTGDFNQDGFADILWQNMVTGQVSIWEMDGNTRIGGGAVSVNPGPVWEAIGTGDFNGDGLSDILFQNTTTGQVSIWEMDGTTRIGGGPASSNPGPTWHAIGTDGGSDILLQNTSGEISIWDMAGTTVVSGGLSADPGAAWRAVGLT